MALDEFANLYVGKINSMIAEHNAKHATLSALTGDVAALTASLYETDPDAAKVSAEIETLLSKVEDLKAKRDKVLAPKVEALKADSAGKVETLNTEVDALRKSIAAATTAVRDLYGDEAVSLLTEVTGKRKSKASADGTPQRRIKGFNVDVDGTRAEIDTPNGKSSNLAVAARVLGVDTKTMQEAFIAAQGTDKSEDYKDSVTFTVNDKDGKGHTVHCYRSAKTEAAVPTAAEVAAAE